jgi:hypothetical protein
MKKLFPSLIVLACGMAHPLFAEKAAPLGALGRMPVKEVTVFKDGHAFVLHEGKLPVNGAGNVQIDYLPAPVLGTFWPYSAARGIKLTAVVAGQRRVLVERTALNLRELLEANTGASVTITENGGFKYQATILGIPERGSDELQLAAAAGSDAKLPQKGGVILLKTQDGVKVVDIARIQDVTFSADHRPTVVGEEFRDLLTLKFDWPGRRSERETEVGLVYLQRGLRWIPGYRVELDAAGSATLKLQATLVNDLVDLEDAAVNLVVGVPSFVFSGMVDPIALQKEAALVSSRLQPRSQTDFAFSNAIMTQVASPIIAGGAQAEEAGPEMAGAEREADLYVFSLKHVTLRKGERMVLPVAEVPVEYQDRYVLEIPIAPPPEISAHIDNRRQAELARLLDAAKVQHVVRLINPGPHPLTTAPALITSQGRLIAQSMMKYTPQGSAVDLDVTAAVDVLVKKQEKEVQRTPNAVRWNGDYYFKVDLSGTLTLSNRRKEPVEVEVVRNILGNADAASHHGKIEKLNVLEDPSFTGAFRPYWWSWYSWPSWWSHFNGIARISWKVAIERGQEQTLTYGWHYFWR